MADEEQTRNKYYDSFGIGGLTKQERKVLEKDELYNLYKKPPKDKGPNQVRFSRSLRPNVAHQADVLYLPNDRRSKYALVVVDVGTRKTALYPFKERTAFAVFDAFDEIYTQDPNLKVPKIIQVDSGSEFKGQVARYFKDKGTKMRVSEVGRSRQQALVEAKNKQIGSAIFKRQTAQELLTGEVDRRWVNSAQKIVEAINRAEERKNERIAKEREKPLTEKELDVTCKGSSCDLIPIGTIVRVKLDKPRDTFGGKLHGSFRAGDVRWSISKHKVTNVLMKPGSPPLYQIDGKNSPAYTKNQLQVVSQDEKAPPKRVIQGQPKSFVIEEILEKDKRGSTVVYKVRLRTGKEDWVTKSELMSNPASKALVQEFEKFNK